MYQDQGADIVVIGGGHAGCEAALAAARLGFSTILFAISLDSIAQMPCNPSIGGTSKGHLVREIDALGGEMGRNIDKTYIQSRMLNTAKGPAVHSLRAQADKFRYKEEMKRTLEHTPNLRVRQNEVVRVDVAGAEGECRKVVGVETATGAYYPCRCAIICTGTYLNARCIHGEYETFTGPNGSQAARGGLTENLAALGLPLRRFKTGTPARVDGKTLDFDEMTIQEGDPKVVPFSFENTPEEIWREQIPCYLTYTNGETHEVIRRNLHRSPLYGGVIHGIGPRYCPSIEDKVVRFADKERHQLFLEPEGENTLEYYVQGMSSSLPEDVQRDMLRTIPGMHHVEIMRTGYAIEYDCVDPLFLESTLEIKGIKGLYSAGQFNGSSGYEEAAAQGLIAGLNAALSLQGKEPVKVDRTNSYIGVLIDDLVTKGTNEPYRMMTSRAEYRLMLRQDNADLRLTEEGYRVGLISEERYQKFLVKKQQIDEEEQRLRTSRAIDKDGHSHGLLGDLLKHPEHTYESLAGWDKERPTLPEVVWQQAQIRIKYEGYIQRELTQIEHFRKLEKRRIPEGLDYSKIEGLRLEARQKLAKIQPSSVGQASRISGVSPADVNVLMVYISRLPKEKDESKEELVLVKPGPEYVQKISEYRAEFPADRMQVTAKEDHISGMDCLEEFETIEDWLEFCEKQEGRISWYMSVRPSDGKIIGFTCLRHKLEYDDDDEEFRSHIGYSVRPSEQRKGYAKRQLALVLKKAAELGIDKVRLICRDINTGSVRTIEACGGMYLDSIYGEESGLTVNRYDIPTRRE